MVVNFVVILLMITDIYAKTWAQMLKDKKVMLDLVEEQKLSVINEQIGWESNDQRISVTSEVELSLGYDPNQDRPQNIDPEFLLYRPTFFAQWTGSSSITFFFGVSYYHVNLEINMIKLDLMDLQLAVNPSKFGGLFKMSYSWIIAHIVFSFASGETDCLLALTGMSKKFNQRCKEETYESVLWQWDPVSVLGISLDILRDQKGKVAFP